MWHYQERPILHLEDLPDAAHLTGFCYKITNLQTGAIYIGKKNVRSTRKKALPADQRSPDKRRKTYIHVTKESNWKLYYGSCEQLLQDIQQLGKEQFHREILAVARTPKYLSYLELYYQFYYRVLQSISYNGNILGKFFSRDMEPG